MSHKNLVTGWSVSIHIKLRIHHGDYFYYYLRFYFRPA